MWQEVVLNSVLELTHGHKSEQAPGDGEGQGGLPRCSPWGRRESDTTQRLNNHKASRLSRLKQALGSGIRFTNVPLETECIQTSLNPLWVVGRKVLLHV